MKCSNLLLKYSNLFLKFDKNFVQVEVSLNLKFNGLIVFKSRRQFKNDFTVKIEKQLNR